MSTHVTVAVARPNHLPIRVYTEQKVGAQWLPEHPKPGDIPGVPTVVLVGGAQTFLVCSSQRLVIEECAAS